MSIEFLSYNVSPRAYHDTAGSKMISLSRADLDTVWQWCGKSEEVEVKYVLVVTLVLIPSIAPAQVVDTEEPPVRHALADAPPSAPAPVDPLTAATIAHHGSTFEVDLGLGTIWASSGGNTSDFNTALAGLDFGFGGWLNDSLALTVRIAGATFSPTDGARFTTGFIGPSLQFWPTNYTWLGGGAGLAFAVAQVDGADTQPSPSRGFGLDLRAGITLNPESDNTINLSIELNPGFFSVDDEVSGHLGVRVYSLGLLLGYQHM